MIIKNNNFKEKIKKIKENNLIEKNDKILIAFSGGPDSVFLFNLLNFLKKDYNLELALVYVNHNIRNDVKNDINFIKNFSSKNNINTYIESIDVITYSKEQKKSIELSARELRYKILENKAKELNYNKIATGHNLDDNIETIIFRMIRGTSIKGLRGIPQKRNNIIRPLLEFKKSDILNFLEINNENYLIDYTNLENEYTRNFIRNEIFPKFLEINPNFKEKINELIKEINLNNNEKMIKKENFINFLLKNNIEINRQKIDKIYTNIFDENSNIKKDGTKKFDMGNGKILIKKYDNLEIIENKILKENIKYKKNLKINQSIKCYNYEIGFYFGENIKDKINNFEKKSSVNYDYYTFKNINISKKLNNLIIKTRENGDSILISNIGHKKIKKILIDKKIPITMRNNLPILEMELNDKKEILCIANIQYSNYFLKKINIKNLKDLENNKIIIIGRKDGR